MKASNGTGIVGRLSAVALVAVLAAGCMGVAGCASGSGSEAPQGDAAVAEREAEAVTVSVMLKGEGWDAETSSKAVLHIVSADGAGVDFYHAVALNASEAIELSEGAYTVTVIPSVNADGSIYKCPETLGIVVADDSKEKNLIEKATTFVPAEEVSAEEMNKIASDLAEAIKKGDESLAGSAGNSVVDKAVENMANSGKVDKESISSVVEEAKEEVAVNGSAATVVTPPSNDYSNNSDIGSSSDAGGPSSTQAPSSNNNGANSSSGNNSSSSSAATQPQKTWVPAVTQTVHHDAVYDTVHHDATYTTIHHDAVTEGHSVYVCDDGYETTSEADMSNHMKTVAKETGVWYGDYTDWRERVVSPAWDETVEASPAWDEQVLVSPAWDETVVVSEGHWE